MFDLRLYVSHRSTHKDRVIQRLEQALRGLSCDYRLEVVDMLDQPERAMDDLVLITPTLIRRRPEPSRRVCGDLSDADRVLGELGLAVAD